MDRSRRGVQEAEAGGGDEDAGVRGPRGEAVQVEEVARFGEEAHEEGGGGAGPVGEYFFFERFS